VPVDSTPPTGGADFEVEEAMPNLNPPVGLYVSETKEQFPRLIVLASIIGALIILFLLWFFLLRGRGNRETPPDVPSAVESPEPEPLPATASAPLGAIAEPSLGLALEPETPESLDASAAEPETAAGSEPLSAAIAEPEPFMPIEEVTEEPKQATVVVPLIEAPVQAPEPPLEEVPRSRPAPPVASYKVPTTIPPSGAPYRIRWGDTLWDISEAFYRNPWLYLRIARFNNIRNPDLIVSGTIIRIPPR
jgi:nucleoid-associated protein YgaU